MRSLLRLLLLLAICLPLGGCTKKVDPLTAAQHFFEQIAAGRAEDAYHSAAFGFQAQRSAVVFATAAKDMGLTDYVGGEWGKPEREGNTVTIRVKLQTKSGKPIPLIVTLVRQAGEWRVFSLRSPPDKDTGISENRFSLVGKTPSFVDAVTKPMPPENEVRQLVRENLLRFNEAIESKSFDAFYEAVSVHWQDQLTKGQLQRAFQPFIDQKISLAGIANATPVFDEPSAVNSDGLLTVTGHYDTQPYRVQFAMKFFYELPAWKLFGLDVNLVK
ncbi:MAG: hypothetical protein ABJF10_14615 [Chthoniobacter sp.]|uniref:hypothetical protein n=1 Tax=Chthoniobacter sp. TaxID=2510640 RepID=UPI0032A9F71B